MAMPMEMIASQLSGLNATDLAKVKQLTDMLLGGQVRDCQPSITDPTERILFEAVKSELKAAGVNGAIGFDGFTESKFYPSWKRGVAVVAEFIDTNFKDYVKTEPQRIGICRILVQTMINDFRRNNIPVSVGTIARNIHRVPQTFERQFPGYIHSGLAYLIPASMLRKK